MKNPFTPGAGYYPPHLAGREVAITAFRDHLRRAASVPRHLVLSGLRGTGKTVLLHEFQHVCQEEGWLCVRRELGETESGTEQMVQAVLSDLVRAAIAASGAARLRRAGRRLTQTLKPKQLGAWGFNYSPAYGHDQRPPLRDQLDRALAELSPAIRDKHHGLVLLYDEFHEVWDGRRRHASPLSTFFGAVKQAQLTGFPLVVVACGLPPVVANIVRSRSYLERDLSVEVVGNLQPGEAAEAISRPLGSTDITFSERLIDQIVAETRGYPYFLQHYCWFLLDSLPGETQLEQSMLNALRPYLVESLDSGFFEGHYAKLPRAERDALVAIAEAGDRVRISEVRWRGHPAALRTCVSRLVERGQLYRPTKRGEVAFSLPLYREFLLRTERLP